jgi:predicted ester cyclase
MSLENRSSTHSAPQHEMLVRAYFHEVLDQGDLELIPELFHPECVMHRPGGTVSGIRSVRDVAERRRETFSEFETEIQDVFGTADRLVVRLKHRGTGRGLWRSRLGSHDVSGKVVSWNAIAIFRFENNRIIEEWVVRDELGMMLQLGLISPSAPREKTR